MSSQTPTDGDSGTDTDNHDTPPWRTPQDVTLTQTDWVAVSNALAADARRHEGEGRHATAREVRQLREAILAQADD